MSTFLRHEPCPACGSSDGQARYLNEDGSESGYCWVCHTYHQPEDTPVQTQPNQATGSSKASKMIPLEEQEFRPLAKRRISNAVTEWLRYGYATFNGNPVQVANYFEGGKLVCQKIRFPEKDFRMLGPGRKDAPLYGQWLFPSGGKKLVITEGELDMASVAQVQDRKWPVVSLPNGAGGALEDIKRHLQYVNSFEQVILMFDQDAPGKKAAQQVARLLEPGKAFIAELPLKDASDCLQQGKGGDIIQAIWKAQPWRPDGVVQLSDFLAEAKRPIKRGMPWPWKEMDDITFGIHRRFLYGYGAGTGVGKTDLFMELAAHTRVALGKPVGLIYLEQHRVETANRLAGKIKSKRFHVPDGTWEEDERHAALDELASMGGIHLYDHWGQCDWETIKGHIRYWRHAYGVQDIFLDHLTALVAHEDDENAALKSLMEEMAGLAQELDLTIHYISHLATPDGKPHEEGGRVMIRHFRGSRTIGYWSMFMMGLERNQQAEDPIERRTTTLRVLKDRFTGQATGFTLPFLYDLTTGRYHVKPEEVIEEDDDPQPF